MDPDQFEKARTDEDRFLDESGYTMDIPEAEWPKSEEEWLQIFAQERELIKQIKSALADTEIFHADLEEAVEIVRSKKIEEPLFAWAAIHRRTRSIMRKQGKTIMLNPTSQLLLRVSDRLKH